MEASTVQVPVVEAPALPAPVAGGRRAAARVKGLGAPLLRLRSDDQLVALFRAGSEEAFRAIHDRYRPRLLVYARQMLGSSRQDAEDALQDVFVRAYRSLRASERPVSLRAWLYRIAHNRCIDQLRRPVPAAADVFDVSRRPLHDPPTETERREELRLLVTDVGRLAEQQRSALLMREMQGMSYEELAQALDVSVAAVKSLLVRARSGLVDAAEARDAACGMVRQDLTLACDRGVRASGVARRHLRDCAGCREYRDQLRGARRRIAALAPVGPFGVLAQAVGAGGSSAGIASSGIGASGIAAGSAGAVVTATKVALVCAVAAVTAGGALQPAHHRARQTAGGHARRIHRGSAAATGAPASWSGVEQRTAATFPAGPAQLVDPRVAGGICYRCQRAPRRHHHAQTFVTGEDMPWLPAPPLPPEDPATAGSSTPTASSDIGSSSTPSSTAPDGSGQPSTGAGASTGAGPVPATTGDQTPAGSPGSAGSSSTPPGSSTGSGSIAGTGGTQAPPGDSSSSPGTATSGTGSGSSTATASSSSSGR